MYIPNFVRSNTSNINQLVMLQHITHSKSAKEKELEFMDTRNGRFL
jgi:hypothetical protein